MPQQNSHLPTHTCSSPNSPGVHMAPPLTCCLPFRPVPSRTGSDCSGSVPNHLTRAPSRCQATAQATIIYLLHHCQVSLAHPSLLPTYPLSTLLPGQSSKNASLLVSCSFKERKQPFDISPFTTPQVKPDVLNWTPGISPLAFQGTFRLQSPLTLGQS